MLTKTTLIGIKALVYLGLYGGSEPVTPRRIARHLGTSPTYMAKVTSLLVKSNILNSYRGALGGVRFNRPAESITLLEIIESCQGRRVAGDYCQEAPDPQSVCAFHRAMHEAHQAIIEVFSNWTLADLIARPGPNGEFADELRCIMADIKLPVPGAR